MYLRQIKKPQGIYLAIQESVYDSTTKQSRTQTIKSLGYLDKLKETYPDPVAHFRQVVEQMNAERKANSDVKVSVDMYAQLENKNPDLRNAGYGILRHIYKDLKIDAFLKSKAKKYNFRYDAEEIFQYLVISQILFPGTIRDVYEKRNLYFEGFKDFTLNDMYSCLEFIKEYQDTLQEWIFRHSQDLVPRDLSVSYYYVNRYCETTFSGPYITDAGKEKDLHKPITRTGLLTDRNGIPAAYDTFTEESDIFPAIYRAKQQYASKKVIVAADCGLKASDKICLKTDNSTPDGYIYGQPVYSMDPESREWALQDGYKQENITDAKGRNTVFTHKSRICTKTLHISQDSSSEKKDVLVREKQVVCYSEKYAGKQKTERQNMFKYAPESDNQIIRDAEKYDGYFVIVTSELDMSDKETAEIYSGTICARKVFETPENAQESLYSEPCTAKNIRAQFAVCFTAAVLVDILKTKLENKYTVQQILDSIRKYNCTQIDSNIYQFLYYDDILEACGKLFGIELKNKYRNRQQIQRMLQY